MEWAKVQEIFKRVEGEPPDTIGRLFKSITLAIDSAIEEDIRSHQKDPEEVKLWGGCPACHLNSGFMFRGPFAYFLCLEHRVCWHLVGSEFLSVYQQLTAEAQLADEIKLTFGFKQVEPWFPALPSYKVKKRLYAGNPSRVYEPGETVQLEIGDFDLVDPIGSAPMAPQKYAVPGYGQLRIEQRAEIAATHKELANRQQPAGSDPK